MQEKPMRRKDRQRPYAEALAILQNGEYGVLATADTDGQPYGVPLSYIVKDGRIYFHCAHDGHKIDNITANPRGSFTVVGRTRPVYEKNFTTLFESVVVFGGLARIDDEQLRYDILYDLAQKYLPDYMDKAESAIKNSWARTAVYGLNMETVTAKAK
jgi:nitroimidazol reductase NimA-like FMN-containing flavoprotein (pyridoxamine 5'-phosphate oxidase superfamily)